MRLSTFWGLWRWRTRRRPSELGAHDPADARRLAALERRAADTPPGCTWLDERTVADLDLGQVFSTIDRTRTHTGAQALWRWLSAPAHDLERLATRERWIAALADAPL